MSEHPENDLLTPWTQHATIRPVVPNAQGHTIHTYFNTCPESPTGRYVLYFEASDNDAHHGQVCMFDRKSGESQVVGRDIENEDGHRVAYQQWVCEGRRIVYQTLRDGQWQVVVVDRKTLESHVMAVGRQLGFADPNGHVVPLHGTHWSPGEHRDLELLDVETGRIDTVITFDQIYKTFAKQIDPLFEGYAQPTSIFFPVLAPGGGRVMFKLAGPKDGTFRSPTASHRPGIITYDLEHDRPLYMDKQWAHPNWHPDGRTILRAGNRLFDTDTGRVQPIPGLPNFPGSHPVVHPNGQIFATDTHLPSPEGKDEVKTWGIAIAPLTGNTHVMLPHQFADTPVTSWRPPHPHPTFSADGKRLYYNANDGQRSQLYVAELPD